MGALLGGAGEGGHVGDTVSVLGGIDAGQFAEGGHEIPVGALMIAHAAGLNLTGPMGDERHADAAFIKVPLVPAQGAIAVKKARFVTALIVRAVVAGEQHEGVVGNLQLVEQIEQLADAAVHAGHHAGKGGDRIFHLGPMAVLANEVLELRKLLTERRHILLGALHGGVRDGDGQVGEERFFGVVADELERLGMDEVVRVGLAIEHHLLIVVPQVFWIKGVSLPLAVVAVEFIPTLVHRIAAGTGRAEAPFAEHPGRVAGFFQQLGNGDEISRDRRLPFGLHLAIAAHVSVPGVHTIKQAAPRGSAHGAAGIMLRELHSGSRHAIDVGCLEKLLPITTEVTIAGVINHDENKVGLLFRLKRQPEAHHRKGEDEFFHWDKLNGRELSCDAHRRQVQSFCLSSSCFFFSASRLAFSSAFCLSRSGLPGRVGLLRRN